MELAQEVALALKKGHSIMYSHRDYCGVGLMCSKSSQEDDPCQIFEFCYVYDGYNTDSIITFRDEKEFVKFLSEQSEYSMSGADEKSSVFMRVVHLEEIINVLVWLV